MSLESLPNVVSIGGGTGLACLLKGLKHAVREVGETSINRPWISRLTAVVTVTDDGGSSGRLRNELQVLPPGDIRNCLVALSADESLLSRLFQYRFAGSGELQGHSFGNLFLTALSGVTGDFLESIRVSSDVLATRGRIYPATLDDVQLEAVLQDGTHVIVESAISKSVKRIAKLTLLPRDCRPVPAVLHAIRQADIITLGPGSLFTSLLPNLLVRGICREIRKSRALKLYIGNLMSQPGETTGFTASDHVFTIYGHARGKLFDGILLNNTAFTRKVLARYKLQGATPVVSDYRRLRAMGLDIYEATLLAEKDVVRHDPQLLANAVFDAYCAWKASDRNSILASV